MHVLYDPEKCRSRKSSLPAPHRYPSLYIGDYAKNQIEYFLYFAFIL